jgi:hypothetical protein
VAQRNSAGLLLRGEDIRDDAKLGGLIAFRLRVTEPEHLD